MCNCNTSIKSILCSFQISNYPGLAIGPEGRVYIADGNNIRMVDEFGIISTLAGHQHHRATWKPMPCTGSLPLDEVQLNWPTDIAINPLDDTLHFIDDDMVLQMTKDGRVKMVAGRPLHCHASQYGPNSPQSAALNQPQSITFSATGSSTSPRATRRGSTGSGRSAVTDRLRQLRARTPIATVWTPAASAGTPTRTWPPTRGSPPSAPSLSVLTASCLWRTRATTGSAPSPA